MAVHTERAFEDAIEASLIDAGWKRGRPGDYDRELGLDVEQLAAFIEATQPKVWKQLKVHYGDDDVEARRQFARYVAKEIDKRGAVDVLRHGVRDRGHLIRLAYFRPAHTLADDALVNYRRNRLSVTRQLAYSERDRGKELDLALFVNGVPVATAELKNPLTGQNVEHAKDQYRHDRDPREPLFAKRTLVHFAVDPDLVFLTTRLAGAKTRFLPFNTGSEGPGRDGGAGNPPAAPGRYRTSYLWEEVWQPEAWLDVIRRFVHLEEGATKSAGRKPGPHARTLIFPRYHQWHAVRSLVAHAAEHGSGHNYLVQHSAGSGKSNTIAWLAHRLSNLHGADNEQVFDKVIVITDRSVLDRQLQDTIYQFEHRAGVVTRISDKAEGSKSEQVSAALAGETTKILIVTLQTFPFVLEKVDGLRGKRFAIIVDEAHSSQSGESAAALKRVLTKLGSDEIDEDGDLLTASGVARGRHETLSYFAFTATPKPKTLELFGTRVGETVRPFHVYSMRQAIEEGFILDVLRNYVTYKTYWRLTGGEDGREVDERKASAALARFAVLSPASLQQRAEIIVEHFVKHTRGRLGGRAKAMVVTRSREHAVKLYRKIKDYVDMRGYDGCGVLVAFSGEVKVDGLDTDTVTEPSLNGFSEAALPQAFAYTRADDEHAAANPKPEYRILVVAEKYQTGFDQPLLTTMYVDKSLKGVAAVQTLSRLNRTHPRKGQDDLFVLDFANEAEDVQASFRPFFEATITTPTHPNLIYDAQRAVMDHQLLVESEMEAFADEYERAQRHAGDRAKWDRAHAELYRLTDPARDRFAQLLDDDPEQAEDFRATLRDYVRKYGFLAQVVGYTDRTLERLYVYGKMLLPRLPRRQDPGIDLGQVDLTHLRIGKTGEHDLALAPEGEQVLPGFSGDGAGGQHERPRTSLAELIAELNERFGSNLGEHDIVRGSAEAAMADPQVRAAAFANDEENFGHVFDDVFEDKLYERIENDTKAVQMFADDPQFNSELKSIARRYAYESLRRDVA
ncbi:type I restriction endonuclease subunit R [Saccharothrix coeruleofusca]|uniref:Type I restriction endonuclease subunit R n=1 Tax=Saccharothrix coeruleofusca TaxID=33919 RepID=A0A918EH48_9PSEU|nr:DEAD/DEAH box helicase family protein [Saccharothrix coeruleofusca]GGP86827.1 type I restriction endonuclease subunit R [Saccharothrix coeruleofusca]